MKTRRLATSPLAASKSYAQTRWVWLSVKYRVLLVGTPGEPIRAADVINDLVDREVGVEPPERADLGRFLAGSLQHAARPEAALPVGLAVVEAGIGNVAFRVDDRSRIVPTSDRRNESRSPSRRRARRARAPRACRDIPAPAKCRPCRSWGRSGESSVRRCRSTTERRPRGSQ